MKGENLSILKKLSACLKILGNQNEERDLIDKLVTQQKKLKEINKEWTRVRIERSEQRKTSYGAFLWQEELLANYHFFAPILGIIDKRLDDVNGKIKFESHFSHSNEEIRGLRKQADELLNERRIVVKNYQETTTHSDPKVIVESLKKYPSYQDFSKVLLAQQEDSTQLLLHSEAVQAYMTGYLISEKIDKSEVLETYHDLYENLHNYREKNQEKVNVKCKKKIQ